MSTLLDQFFPDDVSFSFEALRAAGYANAGAADISEVISICSRIPAGDQAQWLVEWQKAGDRALANARISLFKGNKASARDGFLRASNYYRTAEFYRRESPFDDQLSLTLADASAAAYHAGAELIGSCISEKVSIPYENTTLPAIFMKPSGPPVPRPTLIINGGFDSVKEEVCISFGAVVVDLGFNVLAFDGPGQGEAVRKQRLFFRSDWENVVTPVMDYLFGRQDVNKTKVFIYGLSMGGFLVARAAAFEHRAAAIILNDGIYDFGVVFPRAPPRTEAPPPSALTGIKWAQLNSMWVFGKATEEELKEEMSKYTLEGIVENIKTPTLVMDALDDHFLSGQPEELYKRLKCEKDWVQPLREEGATLHCHVGASSRHNQILGDYLMDRLSS